MSHNCDPVGLSVSPNGIPATGMVATTALVVLDITKTLLVVELAENV